MMKKREYGDRVREVELASFNLLVFSTTGGMGRERTMFYWWLANLLASKQDWAYGTTISWVHCVLTFSLLRSTIMCIYGAVDPSLSGLLLLWLTMSPPDV